MKSRCSQPLIALALFIGLSLALILLSQSGRVLAQDESHEGRDHGSQAAGSGSSTERDPDHAEELPDPQADELGDAHEHVVLSLHEIASARCEHDILTVQCDECRYELGVARLDPNLAAALVKTQTVTVGAGSRDMLTLNGEIELDITRVARVTPTGTGRLSQIQGLLGQQVEAGDVLAILQSAELGRAQAAFLEAQAKAELTKTVWQREQQLFAQEISSQADYHQARTAHQMAQAILESTRKQLELFGSDTVSLSSDTPFGHLALTAPISGTLIQQDAVRGQWVDTQQTLYTVADLSHLWLWATVYEKDLQRLTAQAQGETPVTVQVQVAAFPDKRFAGTLALIGQTMEHDTRTIRIRFDVPNPQGLLRPSMFARVEMALGKTYPIMRIPETAVLSDEGETFVFLRWTEDLWVRRDVVTGRRSEGQVDILSGLDEHAVIATQGAFMFKSEILKEKMGAGCAH